MEYKWSDRTNVNPCRLDPFGWLVHQNFVAEDRSLLIGSCNSIWSKCLFLIKSKLCVWWLKHIESYWIILNHIESYWIILLYNHLETPFQVSLNFVWHRGAEAVPSFTMLCSFRRGANECCIHGLGQVEMGEIPLTSMNPKKKNVDFPWQKIPEATVLQSCDVIMNYDDKWWYFFYTVYVDVLDCFGTMTYGFTPILINISWNMGLDFYKIYT